MRVLITGAAGMLGTALLARAPAALEVVGVDLADGDLTQAGEAERLLGRHRPQVVIHCAAYTDVEGCTEHPEQARLVNGVAAANVAVACRHHEARLVYLSTDYVFAGDLQRAYVETDEPRPLSAYGESKLAGERAVAELPDHLIVRTQWLYGPGGKNFVATIVNAARRQPQLRVVADQYGSPTYTHDLAGALWQVAPDGPTGVMHLTNSGVCSWHELAVQAVAAAGLSTPVAAIAAAEWGAKTVRPPYSPLANARWAAAGHPALRCWREAVREYVETSLAG